MRSTLALVPAVVDAVRERDDEVVVVAAGGVAERAPANLRDFSKG
jgi:NAD(P)H-dependent flavin oxidoreductase YrpB (nitropropane dioxygenase family)